MYYCGEAAMGQRKKNSHLSSNDPVAKSRKLSGILSPKNKSTSWSVSSSISRNDGFFIIDRRCIFFSVEDLDREELRTEEENEGIGSGSSGRETSCDRCLDRGGGGRPVTNSADDPEENG